MIAPAITQFLSLQSPIIASHEGERMVVLAFAVSERGVLFAWTVGLGGGPALWLLADAIDWPAPIQAMPKPSSIRSRGD